MPLASLAVKYVQANPIEVTCIFRYARCWKQVDRLLVDELWLEEHSDVRWTTASRFAADCAGLARNIEARVKAASPSFATGFGTHDATTAWTSLACEAWVRCAHECSRA